MNSDRLYLNANNAKKLINKIKNIDDGVNINGIIKNNSRKSKVKVIGYDNINNFVMCENNEGKLYSVHPLNIKIL
jgi:hypothetical protein